VRFYSRRANEWAGSLAALTKALAIPCHSASPDAVGHEASPEGRARRLCIRPSQLCRALRPLERRRRLGDFEIHTLLFRSELRYQDRYSSVDSS
jgi:hypothetical protein